MYGAELEWINTELRRDAAPHRVVALERFAVRDSWFVVLNAPAKARRLGGHILSAEAARPTGASCFREWLLHHSPDLNESILFITHNGDTYRSWLDMCRVANAMDRSDLTIEGAGDAIMPSSSYNRLLQSFGKLVVSFHINKYGTDVPAVA